MNIFERKEAMVSSKTRDRNWAACYIYQTVLTRGLFPASNKAFSELNAKQKNTVEVILKLQEE